MLGWSVSSLTIGFGAILAVLASVFILQQRRTPQSTAAWLLFIVVMPYLAVPVFLALGFRKQGSRFPPITFSQKRSDPPPPPVHQMDQVFQKFGLAAAEAGNDFKLLTTGEDAYHALIELVRSARSSLNITFYILADDDVGRAFVQALTERVRDGVAVRLILDRLGALRRPRAALDDFQAAGGQLRFFSPFLHPPDNGHMNLRNHRKMVIADGTRAFAGGMNAGRDYLGDQPYADRFVDLSYIVRGPVVRAFSDVHYSDWDVTGKTPRDLPEGDLSVSGTNVVQLIPSGPDTLSDPLNDGLIYAIHNAKTRIWIATPYFLPTEGTGQALSVAARRGVEVRILVPRRSNQRIADFARGAYLRDLAEAGCRIFFHETAMVHAKMAVIDDFGYVGSANFDVRSLLLNFEAALFVYDPESLGQLVNWYQNVITDCGEGVRDAGVLRRIAEGVFRLGAPIL